MLFGSLLCVNALAAPLQGVHWVGQDWETVCDNTGTCRVAGYHQADSDQLISVLLTRPAGTQTVQGKLILSGSGDTISENINLLINHKIVGRLRHDRSHEYPLSQEQADAVVAAIREGGVVQVEAGKNRFTVSNQDSKQAWLKAETFQQLGKLKPQPKPVIKKGKTGSGSLKISAAKKRKTMALLRRQFDSKSCGELHQPLAQVSLYRLNAQNMLAETVCWSTAYNVANVYAVLDKSGRKIRNIVTTDGSDYENGTIRIYQKSSGTGDCWHGEEHVWNGRRFVKAHEWSSGLCRGFGGGAWHLPTFVSDVK